MSSADPTWARGQTPPSEPESERSHTPPPPGFSTHAVARSGQGENAERLGSPPKSLKDFAFFLDFKDEERGFDARLQALADKAMHEDWRGKVKDEMKDRGLLRNFLRYSFEFIENEQKEKRIVSKDGKWTVYDTRLISPFTKCVKPIYALFQETTVWATERDALHSQTMCNSVHGEPCKHGAKCWFAHSEAEIAEAIAEAKAKTFSPQPRPQPKPCHWPKQEWVFKEWCIGWGHVLRCARQAFGPDAPQPYDPNLCSGSVELPSTWTHFDAHLKIVYDVDHILNKNLERLQEIAVNESEDVIALRLDAAIEYAKKPVLNPRRVLPQLYCDRTRQTFRPQLLMPLHLMRKPTADLALTLQLQEDPGNSGDWYYYGSTVLTIGMAYMNARMFDSVESPWLREAAMDGANEKESGFEDLNLVFEGEN